MSAIQREGARPPTNLDAFHFVQALAAEASAGKIEIPSFPEVAVRMRRVLADEDCDATKVAKVAAAEPALAARLLHMANAAALSRGNGRVTELRTAIARLGFTHVRSASLAHAMQQMRHAEALAPLRAPLNALWERSVQVGAMAHVAARSWTRVSADHALLAGLMHGVGRIYILTRSAGHPGLFADLTSLQHILADWHAPIARLVLESWDLSADIIDAVAQFEDTGREPAAQPDLTDVLEVASLMASFGSDPAGLTLQLAGTGASHRLGLTPESVSQVLEQSAGELASLHAALDA